MPRPMLDLDASYLEAGAKMSESARARLHMMSSVFAHAPREIVQAGAEIYKDELKKAAPKGKRGGAKGPGSVAKRGGSLAESHVYRTFNKGGAWGARFYAAYIAAFVILGTKPHEIWAGMAGGNPWAGAWVSGGSWKKALYWQGAAHPFVMVHHPGTKANDYRNEAAAGALPRIKIAIGAWGRGIVDVGKLGKV